MKFRFLDRNTDFPLYGKFHIPQNSKLLSWNLLLKHIRKFRKKSFLAYENKSLSRLTLKFYFFSNRLGKLKALYTTLIRKKVVVFWRKVSIFVEEFMNLLKDFRKEDALSPIINTLDLNFFFFNGVTI